MRFAPDGRRIFRGNVGRRNRVFHPMLLRILLALVVVILIAVALTALLPGGEETAGDQQPGPITPTPAPAATTD